MKNMLDMEQKPTGYYSLDRDNMVAYVPDGLKRLLDIGCGEGNFGKLLKSKKALEVWGVELCRDAAIKAKDKLDRVICADIESATADLPDHYFDCITFNDCLEHLQNPWKVLIDMQTKLVPGGYILASIPNVRYIRNIKRLLIYRDWKYTDEGILDKTHLRFFTKKSIIRMFNAAGLEIITIKGLNRRFSFFFWLLNILTFFSINDMQYLHFACVTRKNT